MSEMLSQEEIDALLGGGGASEALETTQTILSDAEIDAIGEIGNISMGTAATTLFTLLNKKVTITTPKVSETTLAEISKTFFDPSVLIHITYKIGIEGANLLLLHEKDVKIITDLMMGGDGTNTSSTLNDLHLSAIGEAMNQMIGSSSTSLSEMLGKKIDISPPEAFHERIAEMDYSLFGIGQDDPVVKTAFRMTVGDLIDSEIMQILPLDVVKQMVSTLISQDNPMEDIKTEIAQSGGTKPQEPTAAAASGVSRPERAETVAPQPRQPLQQQAQAQPKQPIVNAIPVEFENFDGNSAQMYYNNDIGLIRDVPLEITVELGKTGKRINEILDFGIGTVVELDRLVGESLDVLANGKRIAKGEVVVVEENYGIRITDIVMPKRIIE